MQSADVFIRTQGLISALFNIVLNPLVAWLGNRQMGFVPLLGAQGMVVDTAVTAIVMSLLVATFVAPGARHALEKGRVAPARSVSGGWLLASLPRRAGSLGLLLGFGTACVLTPLVYGLFTGLGVDGLPFLAFALFKALYTGALGYVVTRWVILRQMLDEPARPMS